MLLTMTPMTLVIHSVLHCVNSLDDVVSMDGYMIPRSLEISSMTGIYMLTSTFLMPNTSMMPVVIPNARFFPASAQLSSSSITGLQSSQQRLSRGQTLSLLFRRQTCLMLSFYFIYAS
jgi:hypothetical protein